MNARIWTVLPNGFVNVKVHVNCPTPGPFVTVLSRFNTWFVSPVCVIVNVLARALERRLPADWPDEQFVTAAFEHVLGRPPRNAEATAALAFLERQTKLFQAELVNVDPDARARVNLIHALFNHTDFVTVR